MRVAPCVLLFTVTALTSLFAATANPVQAQEAGSSARRVSVTRSIREVVTPDRVTLTFAAEAALADPADATSRLVVLERAITDTLRRLGVPASAISITPMGVNVVRQPGGYQPGITQYAAQSLVRVSLDRIDRLSAVTSAALGSGGVHVNQPAFEVAAEDSVRRALVARAIAEARRDGEVIAMSMGGRLGPMIEVMQNSTSSPVTYPEMVVFPSTAQFTGFPGRQPTSAVVSANVTVRWAFIEGG